MTTDKIFNAVYAIYIRYTRYMGQLLPELRANSKIVSMIGHECAAYTDKIHYPYVLQCPALIYGMRLDIDENIPDGYIAVYTHPYPHVYRIDLQEI